ncbi:UNVERIFIED_CONTAM: hypothetical protein K2H54_056581 [Gekko kuhli]
MWLGAVAGKSHRFVSYLQWMLGASPGLATVAVDAGSCFGPRTAPRHCCNWAWRPGIAPGPEQLPDLQLLYLVKMSSESRYVLLPTGQKMPLVGLGTWKSDAGQISSGEPKEGSAGGMEDPADGVGVPGVLAVGQF